MIDILAFGGGVGSWGYAALVAQERIRAPWLGVIVDTGRECPSTWEYIERHRDKLPFMLYIVKQPLPSLYSGNGGSFLPGGYDRAGGAWLAGFCSTYWKRDVMRRELRRVKRITQYNLAFGIHADEWRRMQKGRIKSMPLIYPLVDLGITRADCATAALEVFGELPPRSRCWMCPGQRPDEWQEIAETWPGLYSTALEIDAMATASHNLTLFSDNHEHPCGSECFT